ncbi:MAG TPA: hypothetical protein VLY83_04095 [Methanoregula sp.]|nr:hypothetical protein [Methanoregula sp.]
MSRFPSGKAEPTLAFTGAALLFPALFVFLSGPGPKDEKNASAFFVFLPKIIRKGMG